MQEILLLWGYPVANAIVAMIAVTRKDFPGKGWLLAHLFLMLATVLAWRIPPILGAIEKLRPYELEIAQLLDFPLLILSIGAILLLIPFLFAIGSSPRGPLGLDHHARTRQIFDLPDSTTSRYDRVGGWLKFFIVVNTTIAPLAFVILQTYALYSICKVSNTYPKMIVIGVIEAAAGSFFVIKWIAISRKLNELKFEAVQETRKWLFISFAWAALTSPLVLIAGIDLKIALPWITLTLMKSALWFALWDGYFKRSRRVKETYIANTGE